LRWESIAPDRVFFKNVTRHRRVFELPDASSADNYISEHLWIEVISAYPNNLVFLEAVMKYGIARTYSNTVAAPVARLDIHRL